MKRPIIIVDPRSSGAELAPAFKAQGIPVIAISLNKIRNRIGYNTDINSKDFDEVIPDQSNIIEKIKSFDPLAIIAGAEAGIPLAEKLALAITPHFSNKNTNIINRLHKAQMQFALHKALIPSLDSLECSSEKEAANWIQKKGYEKSQLIIKPAISAGSERVFHISEGGDWQSPFGEIITQTSNITGKKNVSAVIQEKAIGTEYAIGTVSANGNHYLAHLIKYKKISYGGRDTVYDFVEFIDFDPNMHGEMLDYTFKVLDALGVRWGACHNEVILTEKGPRLIESVPRMCGGPVNIFAREATGSSQVDKLVEIFTEGDVKSKQYSFKKLVIPVFIKSPKEGIVSNSKVLNSLDSLPTLFKKFIWFKDGDQLPKTVDYITNIGIVALAGDRNSIFEDYAKVRQMESQLIIN